MLKTLLNSIVSKKPHRGNVQLKDHPVSSVKWVPAELVYANDYNPNYVAPPEMKLLEISIKADGFTQPIVTWQTDQGYEVIDGFHRHLVGKSIGMSHLPIVVVNDESTDRNDRIASTIRHNRARGKHKVTAMSDIVVELTRRFWSDEKIGMELGMEPDEVLRLKQITGLAEMFKDVGFSEAWDLETESVEETEEDEELENSEEELNQNNTKRIFHTYDKWECYQAGFYKESVDGLSEDEAKIKFAEFLKDPELFASTLEKVITEWKHSCEHFLTNTSMNRIAWLGQAAVVYHTGIPSKFKSGWFLLSKEEQDIANNVALEYLNKWLDINNML